jgi:ubiquinone/menaquinone biosynthesis C-methylase UbiE
LADSYPQHAPLLGRINAFVSALPGVPPAFVGKYQLLADPPRGGKRMRLLQYELEVAGCDPRGQIVLDAGAGTGLYSVMFALLGAQRVEAIDFFPQNIEYLDRVAKEFSLPIHARRADIANTGLEPNTVGLVYCTEAISHFHQWQAFLDETARVLKPGGHVIIADGNNGANPTILRHIQRFWEESETGPFTTARFRPGQNLPYLFRRWMIIKREFPNATDEQVFQLGLHTSDRGGSELVDACRRYLESGQLPGEGYRHGQSQRRPEDGQRNEEPLDPRDIAAYLRSRGLRARARAHFGFGRNPLLPAVNQVASWFGSMPLRIADRYLVIATK